MLGINTLVPTTITIKTLCLYHHAIWNYRVMILSSCVAIRTIYAWSSLFTLRFPWVYPKLQKRSEIEPRWVRCLGIFRELNFSVCGGDCPYHSSPQLVLPLLFSPSPDHSPYFVPPLLFSPSLCHIGGGTHVWYKIMMFWPLFLKPFV